MKTAYTFAPINDYRFPLQHHLIVKLTNGIPLPKLGSIIDIHDIESHPDEFDEGSVFIFSKNDIHNFDDTLVWDKVIRCKNKKILINHSGFSLGFELSGAYLLEFLQKIQVKNENIFIILPTVPDKEFIESKVSGCNCMTYDEWLHEYKMYVIDNPQVDARTLILKKRFGLFVRRYSKERLNFFVSLFHRELLKHFHYTFSNWESPDTFANQTKIMQDINPKLATKFTKQWTKGIPYSYDMGDTTSSAYTHVIESYIKRSHIIIVQETSAQLHSSCTITEKTYKAIYNKRPFIILGHCKILEYLRSDGFLTFHPFIDESYDQESSYSDRVTCIINQIERLANMSDSEFQDFLNSVRHITAHNYKRLNEILNAKTPDNFLLKNLIGERHG